MLQAARSPVDLRTPSLLTLLLLWREQGGDILSEMACQHDEWWLLYVAVYSLDRAR